MAILKELTDSRGQNVNYHKIASFKPIYVGKDQGLLITLISYTSEEYRQIEKEDFNTPMAVTSTDLFLPLMEDDVYTRKSIYNSIMNMPGWEDSEEV